MGWVFFRLLGKILGDYSCHVNIALSGPGVKRGVVKKIVAKYGIDLANLNERQEILEAKLSLRGRQLLKLCGSKEELEKVGNDGVLCR